MHAIHHTDVCVSLPICLAVGQMGGGKGLENMRWLGRERVSLHDGEGVHTKRSRAIRVSYQREKKGMCWSRDLWKLQLWHTFNLACAYYFTYNASIHSLCHEMWIQPQWFPYHNSFLSLDQDHTAIIAIRKLPAIVQAF